MIHFAQSRVDGFRQVLAVLICLPTLPFLWLASKVAPKVVDW